MMGVISGVAAEVVTIAGWAVAGAIVVTLAGYMTPKVVLWGSIAAGLVWMMSPLVPVADQAMVQTHFITPIEQMVFAYPTMLVQVFSESTAYGVLWKDFVGGLTVVVMGIVYLPGYLAGIYVGTVTYPELILFRLIL